MIWNHISYRTYLIEKLGGEGTRTGLRKKLAAAIPVHTTFVSQVLKGQADFSLEQAESINEFFQHTKDEGEYFILLVLKDRAGSRALKARFTEKIKAMREERLNIKSRVKNDSEISQKDREKFYSSYLYGALHVLTSIPEFRNAEKLSEALRLPRERVQEILEFLIKIGVIVSQNGELRPGSRHIHLGGDSELVLKHHANWRLHTLSKLQFNDPTAVHYSACVSLSRDDALRVKESILANLENNIKIISKSPEEEAYVYTFDFYRLLD